MAMEKCIAEVMSAMGGGPEATSKAAKDMLERIEARASVLEKTGLSAADAAQQAGKEVTDMAAAAAAIEKRNALLNLQKRVGRREALEAKAEALGGKHGVDLVRAIRNQLVAINTYKDGVIGGRRSVSGDRDTMHLEYLGGAVRELENAGLFQAARGNQVERLWGREMYELSKRDVGEPSNPGVTGSAEALKIAEALHKYSSLAKSQLNREGAWIGDYSGYITRTAHNVDKLRRAGFENWRDTIAPLLDADRTFEGVADRNGMLRGVYNALRSGVHLSDAGGVGMKDPAFSGPANLSEKLSEGRVLHFRDADSWLDYQQKFGNGTLLEQTLNSYNRAAQARALMSKFGTNPEAEFDQDIRWAKEKYRDTNLEAVEELNRSEKNIRNIFDNLSGEASRPANELMAKIGSYTRLDQTMAKLGGVALTHMSSAVSKSALLRYHGLPLWQAYGDFFAAPFRQMKAGAAQQWADEMLAGMEGTNRDIIAAFAPNDAIPGTASKLANLYFKLNGLTWLLNKQKAGAEWTMSRQLGRVLDVKHGDLPPATQRMLAQYDISPAEWDMLRKVPDHVQVDGRQFLTPGAAARVPDADIEANLRNVGDTFQTGQRISDKATPETVANKIAAFRDELALKVHGMYRDLADQSVVTPTIEDRADVLQGLKPGTLGGEVARFIAQFKMWPVAAARQMWGREIYGGQSMAGKMGGMMNLAVGSMLTGYAIMTLKGLLKGQMPRNPLDPKSAIAGMMQGGGFGIFGDYLFGEQNRFGQGVSDTILGPVLGQGVNTVFDAYNKLKAYAEGDESHRGIAKDLVADTVKATTDNAPFINLNPLRQAVNYLFLHSLQEWISPGYLQRQQANARKQQGVTYYLSPQSHLKTFGH